MLKNIIQILMGVCILLYIIILLFTKEIPTYFPKIESLPISVNISSENFSDSKQNLCISSPQINVFMYHYIREDDPNDTKIIRNLSVTPKNFESHMKRVSELAKEGKFALMNMENFVSAFEKRCFPHEKIWVFTSDDGWIDNEEYLAPIAEKYRIPFIFGIISDKIGEKGFISAEGIKKISDNPLFGIASHSVTHRMMNTLSESEETKEMCESKKSLELLTEKDISIFIYPVGKISKNSAKILQKCGYKFAWSTSFGKALNWNDSHFFNMNRTRVGHDMGTQFFDNLAK